jgi:hypothetical protein
VQDPEQRDDVDAARPAVDHGAQLGVRRRRIEPPHVVAGAGPSTRASVPTVFSTLATRPNASAAAQNPTTSWSSGFV